MNIVLEEAIDKYRRSWEFRLKQKLNEYIGKLNKWMDDMGKAIDKESSLIAITYNNTHFGIINIKTGKLHF